MHNAQKWQHKIFSHYKRLGLTVVCCEPQGILTFTNFEFMNPCTAYRHNENSEFGDLWKGVIRFCTKPQKSLLFCSKQFFPVKEGIKITVWDMVQCSVRSLFQVSKEAAGSLKNSFQAT